MEEARESEDFSEVKEYMEEHGIEKPQRRHHPRFAENTNLAE
tara:strand:+ start:880 stop:1005 length:126 start_codon:yes stop_codon:yes gene_type:complete